MPYTKIKSSSGKLNVYYTISTPTNENAKKIDKNLPTVLFLHPVYIGQQIYHPQFTDPSLRRFNLVTMDSRCHGNSDGPVPDNWGRNGAAEDVFEFMKALHLPPVHICGLSMGACTGLSVSMNYPDRVLSLFMISPLPMEEPRDVVEGRTEIYEFWAEGVKAKDEQLMTDAMYGALQLGFNNAESPFISALVKSAVPQAKKNWSLSRLPEYRRCTLDFFCGRKAHPIENLAKIKAPIRAVNCGKDIAYPVEYVHEFLDALHKAGVKADMVVEPEACHFGSVTHSKSINRSLHEWILTNETQLPAGPIPSIVRSPWRDLLGNCDTVDSEEEEDEVIGQLEEQMRARMQFNIAGREISVS